MNTKKLRSPAKSKTILDLSMCHLSKIGIIDTLNLIRKESNHLIKNTGRDYDYIKITEFDIKNLSKCSLGHKMDNYLTMDTVNPMMIVRIHGKKVISEKHRNFKKWNINKPLVKVEGDENL